MSAILSRFVFVILIFILSFASSVRAAEYEERVSIPSDSDSSSTSGGNDPGYTTSTPPQGNTGNWNSTNQGRSSNSALRDSAHKAGGTIIEAIGDAIGQSIRNSFNQGGSTNTQQSDGQINSFAPASPQPSQESSQTRRKKKITDY